MKCSIFVLFESIVLTALIKPIISHKIPNGGLVKNFIRRNLKENIFSISLIACVLKNYVFIELRKQIGQKREVSVPAAFRSYLVSKVIMVS